ncbi:MAG: hypothetical protein RL660_2509 [Bacteroidota bacterium]|jgi:hypothetical protein
MIAERIRRNTKYSNTIYVVFVIVILLAFLYFRKNYLHHKQEVKTLISKELSGKLNTLDNINRGSYNLKIGDYTIHSLPIADDVKKFNIQLGDSVRKEANSTKMVFYKKTNGTFENYCEYIIRP